MPTLSEEFAKSVGLKSGLQTVLIPLSWSEKKARSWLTSNGMRSDYHRKTVNFHRYMQMNPVSGATYYTKKLHNGVELVFEKF